MFYMFEIQIPVDAYPPFGLKRRSFLFVIDKKLSTFAEFFIAKKENAKPYRFAFFAWFINFYFTSNVKVMSPEPNAWLSERHHWKLSLSKRPITNV